MLRIIFLVFSFYCCNQVSGQGKGGISGGSPREKGSTLRNGQYRALLERKDGNSIVFNFEVKDSAGKKVLYIRNAGEKLLVDDIKIKGDSVLVRLPFFESQLRANLTKDGNWEGVWLKRGADAYSSVPFKAFYGQSYRFVPPASPDSPGAETVSSGVPSVKTAAENPHVLPADVSGRWSAVFVSPDGKDSSLRIGEFSQKANLVTGTFLDPTGDLRFLEGNVDGDSLRLSCFDGGHAYSFSAKIEGNQLSGGQYYMGGVGRESWTAMKNPDAKLPDEFTLTRWKKDAGPLDFSFKDLEGKTVSIRDNRFKGKIVIVQIMGSWCPNCMDETRFMSPFYEQYRKKGVEVIGLAYERSTDFARSQNSLRSFQQRFKVKYPILITGVTVSDPKRTEKTLPQLEEIVGFPTTIFIDRKGLIYRIHTGFNGPGTGEHYEEQKKEFYKTVDGMLGE